VSDVVTAAFVVSLLAGMVRIATPVLFAALGELVTEHAGILNLGIEGMMLTGAFTGFITAHSTGSLWLGVASGILAGVLVGVLMAFLSATLKADQVVAGLAINLLASGLTFYLFRVAFRNVGAENLPSVATFGRFEMPLLSKIWVVGDVLFSQPALTYVALACVPLISLFLYRTRPGLEIRMIGENPRAVDMRGVGVTVRQYAALAFGGGMAGAGGAFLTLDSAGLFVPQISGGRGFIAFAIVIVGNWTGWKILLASLFFGLLDSLSLQLQAVGVDVPHQLLLALPYVLTILVLVIGRHRTNAPLALGRPYVREI
jgi:ABC-type uncharacterized transport system permease subunit